MQYGKSDHETKSCGAYGGADAPTVNASVVGNFHPSVAVEMMRGLRGDHGCQTIARCTFVSGPPIQPHEEYAGIAGDAKMEWSEIAKKVQNLLGKRPRPRHHCGRHAGTRCLMLRRPVHVVLLAAAAGCR